MPRKIRQLEADLLRAGFIVIPGRGKGSHRSFQHPDFPFIKVVIAGQRGDDAKAYQERLVLQALSEVDEKRDERNASR